MGQNNVTEAIELLKQSIALLEQDTTGGEKVSLPEASDIETLDKTEMLDMAKALGLDIDGRKASEVRAALTTAANLVHDQDTVPDKEELASLCELVGIAPSKKAVDTATSLREYFDAGSDDAPAAPAKKTKAADDDDEKPAKKVKAAAEDDDDDEKPAKRVKAAKDDDDDDDADAKPAKKVKAAKDDDDDEDEKPAKSKKAAKDDDDDDEPANAAKLIKLYNKAASEDNDAVETWAELKEKLTDNDGDVAEWGVAYAKGEEAYCCGLPLKPVKGEDDQGKCAVTGKIWTQNKQGKLVEVEAE